MFPKIIVRNATSIKHFLSTMIR